MKLNLLDAIGEIGVITKAKSLIRDRIEIEVDREGLLVLTNVCAGSASGIKKVFKTFGGRVLIDDFDLPQGTSKLVFTTEDGKEYACGELNRNGRFISVKNNVDKLAVELAIAYGEVSKRCEEMREELATLKHQYGITII